MAERPRWAGHSGQPAWVGAIVVHLGRQVDWLLDEILDKVNSLIQGQEHEVATLNDLINLDQNLADGVTRIAGDFDALKATLGQTTLSPEDQAAVDAAVAQVQGSVDLINNSDPVQQAAGSGDTTIGDGSGTATPPADGGTDAGSTTDPSASTDQPSV